MKRNYLHSIFALFLLIYTIEPVQSQIMETIDLPPGILNSQCICNDDETRSTHRLGLIHQQLKCYICKRNGSNCMYYKDVENETNRNFNISITCNKMDSTYIEPHDDFTVKYDVETHDCVCFCTQPLSRSVWHDPCLKIKYDSTNTTPISSTRTCKEFGNGRCIELVNETQRAMIDAGTISPFDRNYECTECPHPTVGPHCTFDECLKQPCKNDGICQHTTEGNFICTCIDHFEGHLCETRDMCKYVTYENQCKNGGTCVRNGNDKIDCICPDDYHDSTNLCKWTKKCKSNPCVNSVNLTTDCMEEQDNYICKNCKLGWEGPKCDIKERSM